MVRQFTVDRDALSHVGTIIIDGCYSVGLLDEDLLLLLLFFVIRILIVIKLSVLLLLILRDFVISQDLTELEGLAIKDRE